MGLMEILSHEGPLDERKPGFIGSDSLTVPLHPLGIKPAGNAYVATGNIKSATGLFAILPDELLVQILESLDAGSLRQVELTCKTLYAFARLDDLWKTLCTEVDCTGLFSDVLHRPFLCSVTPLLPYASNIPDRNAIPKLSNLSPVDFAQNWTDLPFVLTEPVQKWPVYREWSTDTMLEQYGDIKFRAEAVDWSLKTYVDYMNDSQDESPLYLFDRLFVEKMDLKVGRDGQYWSPESFGEDLFAVLEDQRPDSHWLIVGPERSGSTFHKDPNATSAWNAVLKGSKYWIMFTSSSSQPPPPGVFVSEDQSEVTSPLSIAEWLLGFHAAARATPGCREGICNEGEVLHVPSGWWHLVVNLEPSIAITQNFVPGAHLANVLDFLKNKSDQISGFKKEVRNPYELFVGKMLGLHPELLKRVLNEMENNQQGRKRKWDQLLKDNVADDTKTGRFGFGFGDAEDEEVP